MNIWEKDGGPAFPSDGGDGPGAWGMTLRDWFAGQALIGMMRTYRPFSRDWEQTAEWAYAQADAIIRARESGQ